MKKKPKTFAVNVKTAQAYPPGYRFTGIVTGAGFTHIDVARRVYADGKDCGFDYDNTVPVRFENPYGKVNAGDRIRVRVDRFYAGKVIARKIEVIPYHDISGTNASWSELT